MAIRSSSVTFYEYIGWYASEAYMITYFTISPYNFKPESGHQYNPYAVDFELQGSNDNSNWTTIQSYSDMEESLINYVNPYGNGYRGYRVKVLSNSSNASSIVATKMVFCNELGFYGVRFEDAHKHLSRSLVPVMTSFTTPRGIATAGTDLNGSSQAWNAFDNNSISSWHSGSFTGAALNEEQYLGWYDTTLFRRKVLTAFSLHINPNIFMRSSSPFFKLQGTLDGFTWYDIETFSKTYTPVYNWKETFYVSKENYVECNGFRLLFIAPNVGAEANYIHTSFLQVWALDHGVFNVPNVSGKLFKLYEGTSVLKLGKNVDAPYIDYDTSSLGTVKNATVPLPAGYVSIDSGVTVDVEDYPEAFDKLVYVGKEYSMVPALTSNTSEGVVEYSNYYVNGLYTSAHLVFDGLQMFDMTGNDKGYYSYNNMSSTQSSNIGWYNLSLNSKKVLKAFLVYGRTNGNTGWTSRTPKVFNVQGTLDGTNWTTIQSYSDTSSYHAKYFRVDSSNTNVNNAYYGFRLQVFEAWSGELILSQLKFIVEDYNEEALVQLFPSSLVPVMDYNTGSVNFVVTNSNYEEVVNQNYDPNDPFFSFYTEELYKAFDPNLNSTLQSSIDLNYSSLDISNHSPFYIGWYDTSLNSKKIVTGVFLHSYSKSASQISTWSRLPFNFKVEGTNDGTNWELIESISEPNFKVHYHSTVNNRTKSYYGFRLLCVLPTSLILSSNIGLIFGLIDFQCVNETDLYSIPLASNAGKMMKLSNGAEVQERLNDNLVEVGSLALDTLSGNNELSVGATKKWNGVGYVPRGFAVMRGQKIGTLDYPKVFEALVDLQTPFVINPAMSTYTSPSGVIVYSSEYNNTTYAADHAFNRVLFDDNVTWITQEPAVYPEHIGWYDTSFDKKKILMEFYLWARFYDAGTDVYGQFMPGVFSVQGTLDGTSWTTLQTYDMMFTGTNGYDKGVFVVDEINRHTAYYGFRILIFNRVGNQSDWIGLHEVSFYVIDEPSKPVVLEPKPLVPNYTDWDNPSGNLVYSSYATNQYYPWRAFNNEYVNHTVDTTNNKFGWASYGNPIDRTNTSPYIGEYIGWYNTQLLKKKVLIYTRWTIGYVNTNRYHNESAATGFVQGTLDGINWENIHSFDTKGKYIEYYAENDNRSKGYYGFRLYFLTNQIGTTSYAVVLDSLQFMCLDEDEYFTFELPDSPDTLVNLERVQGIAVEGSIGTNSRGDGLSIVVDNNSEINSALVVSNNIGNEIEEASTTLLNVRNNGGVDIGGYLRIGMSSIDAGQNYQGRFSLFIATTYSDTDPYKYGWWIGGQDHAASSSDNDLHFTVLKDGVPNQVAMIQDSRSSVVEMNFTGQHRTFVKDVSMSSMEDYEGLIVCASQDAYVKMSGGIATGQDAITTNESLPLVSLSRTAKDKRCFGVVSSKEDPEQRKEVNGNFVSLFQKEKGDTRVYINSVGEGAMWVVSGPSGIGGFLESGDYITTSHIPGYGCLQDDDLLHNYTVAKITMNCNFDPPQVPKMTILKNENGDNLLDNEGLLQWTELLDNEGNMVYEDKYKVRYLLGDGTLLSKDEFLEALEHAYVAAFVGCTYHCG